MNWKKEGKYYLWGAGNYTRWLNEMFPNELEYINIDGYIDNDPKKWGKIYYGKPIYSPDVLREYEKKYIIIAVIKGVEIKEQILKEYMNFQCIIIDEIENIIKQVQLLMRYKDCEDKDIREIMDYLKVHPLQTFNYKFTEKYSLEGLCVNYDKEKKLYFAIFNKKKMYFSRSLDTKEKAITYYRSILLEQDVKSPHRYLTDIFDIPKGATVIDAGVAEGNFSLSIIENVKKIFLFEPDEKWIEALQYTFEPFKNKVHIIKKNLSNYINEFTTTIDESLGDETIDFIKMDIEGEELYALQGAKKSINKSKEMKCVICTYHQEFAHEVISNYLEKNGFELETSIGYMWFPESSLRAPVLRRGIIRAKKYKRIS